MPTAAVIEFIGARQRAVDKNVPAHDARDVPMAARNVIEADVLLVVLEAPCFVHHCLHSLCGFAPPLALHAVCRNPHPCPHGVAVFNEEIDAIHRLDMLYAGSQIREDVLVAAQQCVRHAVCHVGHIVGGLLLELWLGLQTPVVVGRDFYQVDFLEVWRKPADRLRQKLASFNSLDRQGGFIGAAEFGVYVAANPIALTKNEEVSYVVYFTVGVDVGEELVGDVMDAVLRRAPVERAETLRFFWTDAGPDVPITLLEDG